MKKLVLWGNMAALLLMFGMMSCASTPEAALPPEPLTAIPPVQPEPDPPSPGVDDIRELILVEGEKFIDTPYKSPPKTPENFDCSGFVSFLFRENADMDLPTSSGAYINAGELIDFNDAKPGDLLIFTSEPGGKQINHVAILYKKSDAGELRGSQLLHAISIPTKTATLKGNPDTTGVKISELGKRGDGRWQQEYFLSRFFAVRRVFDD
ncbi:MAG: C40 family peptidase [Treponema sp.]|jgi:cell wall-associated NlpC family hydrolase|nr:C40 family peptidase [Treponema sp.]